MTQQLIQLRDEVSRALRIIEWSPSEFVLKTIAREISKTQPQTIGQLSAIVSGVCPGLLTIATEGVDNSDLRTVLMLAIAAAAKG